MDCRHDAESSSRGAPATSAQRPHRR
jgi:hypothetical protein